jgi:hypothetical protein
MDSRGWPPTLAHVEEIANILATQKGLEPVGKLWRHNFIKRTPRLKTKLSRRLDWQRARNEQKDAYIQWFELVKNMINFHGILEDDIYNFDETGFRLGQAGNHHVVTTADRKGRPTLIGSDSSEWVTIIACVNARGWQVPPFVIFKGVTLNKTYFEGLPPRWTLACSENGWTSNALGLRWIEHFHRHTQQATKGVKRLLVLDRHGSHLTPEFDQYCKDHNIVTLCLPPHSSHRLQPLDVSCFGPLKTAYTARLERLFRASYYIITKDDFLAEIPHAIAAAFTASNIQAGFRGAGLVPFNPEAVLEKLTLRTVTPPLQTLVQWTTVTPSNPREVDSQTAYIENKLQRSSTSPSEIVAALRQNAKGYHKAAAQLALLQAEVSDLR